MTRIQRITSNAEAILCDRGFLPFCKIRYPIRSVECTHLLIWEQEYHRCRRTKGRSWDSEGRKRVNIGGGLFYNLNGMGLRLFLSITAPGYVGCVVRGLHSRNASILSIVILYQFVIGWDSVKGHSILSRTTPLTLSSAFTSLQPRQREPLNWHSETAIYTTSDHQRSAFKL